MQRAFRRQHEEEFLDEPAQVQFLVGRRKGAIQALHGDRLTIGRHESNDITIPSDAISRTHAILTRTPEGWKIKDKKSKIGIQINGKAVPECLMQSGDLIQIGDAVFRFIDPKVLGKKQKKLRNRPKKSGSPSLLWLLAIVVGALGYQLVTWKEEPPVEERSSWAHEEKVLREIERGVDSGVIQVNRERIPDKGVLEVTPAKVSKLSRNDLVVRPTGEEGSRDLEIYLQEGRHYLEEGDFVSAKIAFNFARLIDPKNKSAQNGIEAAEKKPRRPASAPVQKNLAPSYLNERVAELLVYAHAQVTQKHYEKALHTVKQIESLPIKGDETYREKVKAIAEEARRGLASEASKSEAEP